MSHIDFTTTKKMKKKILKIIVKNIYGMSESIVTDKTPGVGPTNVNIFLKSHCSYLKNIYFNFFIYNSIDLLLKKNFSFVIIRTTMMVSDQYT